MRGKNHYENIKIIRRLSGSNACFKKRHGYVRSVDIAAELGVTKPSVSYATKRLRENGYITMDTDGLITLTSAGMDIAKRIYERHNVLTDFFIALGVDDETADEDACKVEHEISEATFAAIQNYMKQLKN